MYLLSEDYQYHATYFIVGNPWIPIFIVVILALFGVMVYMLIIRK